MKKILVILFLFPLLVSAQKKPFVATVITDTIFYDYKLHQIIKIPGFIEVYTKQEEKQVWERKIYDMEMNLLAKGNVILDRKKFKIPKNLNFSLIDSWIYFDANGSILKERNYGRNMQNPEEIHNEIAPNIHVSTW